MSEILFHYEKVYPTTWAYLSSLLMIGLFFKFNRFWSVRNLDLVLLILLAPGLLLQTFGHERALVARYAALAESAASELSEEVPGEAAAAPEPGAAEAPAEVIAATPTPLEAPGAAQEQLAQALAIERIGYIWLLAVGALLLIRLLLDATMVRRPLLEPNLSTGGLVFIGCSLFVFLMANVIVSQPTEDDLVGPKSAEQLLSARAGDEAELAQHGPGNAILHLLPSIPTMPLMRSNEQAERQIAYVTVAKLMAILSHLAIVVGIIAIGYQHFDNIKMGIGAATLYLMLPYTAHMTGRVAHVLPGALLIWAILCYRRPFTAGMFIGLAAGVIYYPLFLLPLWLSFYWQRGLMRFTTGVLSTIALMAFSLLFVSTDATDYWNNVQEMFGAWPPLLEGLGGIWGLGWDPHYRLPVLAAFIALSGTMALWPAQKNLGTLLSCSGAVMVATQFWHGFGGGLYMAWYLPLALLTIFRPNLEDRVALTVLGESWFPRRRTAMAGSRAA